MHPHRKRPYNKPTITIIPTDSPQYEKLMQSLPQQEESTDESAPVDDSVKKEVDKHV